MLIKNIEMDSRNNVGHNIESQELYSAFKAAHESALRAGTVPECKWKELSNKLRHAIFDAGENFVYIEDNSLENVHTTLQKQVFTKCSMGPDDEHIYLIDHAWTYTLETAQSALEQNESLIKRMATIMDVPTSETSIEATMKLILKKMWLFNNCYIVSRNKVSPTIDCWYILDEFGSSIRFSKDPSFQLVSFYYLGDQSMYSLLFPKRQVSEGEEVTVAYPSFSTSFPTDVQQALMHPWSLCDLSEISYELSEPPIEYFASGRCEDILPQIVWSEEEISMDQPLEVWSDFSDVAEFLTHPSFKVVTNIEEAKILWLGTRQYNIRQLVETYPVFRFISQFPSEHVLINKDLLASVCRRVAYPTTVFDDSTLESCPEWLATTFNLRTELPKFVSYYQHRQKRNLDNVWMCKPFNLARGLGIIITDNLAQIIRLSQVHSLVACKYIIDPVLFPLEERGLVKMDLRYIVLLKSFNPLQLYIYDRFWIRFANKSFILDDFSDYEAHFTVMNYGDYPLKQMFCEDFIKQFEDHHSPFKWSNIQETINKMIVQIFKAATQKDPPAGIGNFCGSRAMYGLDIMLRWDRNRDAPEIKPVILEVNWMPDCKRACQYYPEFYNDIFSILFLGDSKDKHATRLL